jgi:hypothetical protein
MFRTVPLPIIRNLFTVNSAKVYVIQVRAGPGWSCSTAVYKPVWHLPLLSLQWKNSWWWAEELSETCRVSCQNKFVKLVHLVDFIIKKKYLCITSDLQVRVVGYNLKTSRLLAVHEDLRSTGFKLQSYINLSIDGNKGRLHLQGSFIPKEEGENGCEKWIKKSVQKWSFGLSQSTMHPFKGRNIQNQDKPRIQRHCLQNQYRIHNTSTKHKHLQLHLDVWVL